MCVFFFSFQFNLEDVRLRQQNVRRSYGGVFVRPLCATVTARSRSISGILISSSPFRLHLSKLEAAVSTHTPPSD